MEQQAFPEYPLASAIDRFVARMIDNFIGFFGGFTIIYIGVQIPDIPYVGIVLGLVCGFGYLLTKDALPFLNGQSLGKKVMNIRVVKTTTGKDLTGDFGTCFVRQIVMFIPILNLIDALVMLGDKRQRLVDQWMDTKVIKEQ